jgi:autotransporter-associated beta strand protein
MNPPILRALLLIAMTGFAARLAAQIPAFPGAQGFGAYATGGRGGDVYYVTNLNANGAGSLRSGIDNAPATGRTIVFAVSGYISLPGSNLRLVQNKITIAGQTAPGDGIGFRDGTVRITGNNAVLRHLRIRHGKYGSGGDCMNLDSSATNSIIDHVTMMFSTDENISFFSSSLDNFTMQYSVTTWGMERHNAGGLWDLNRGTSHHSLWAHHRTRNPKSRPTGLLEWINNVTFDWRSEGFIMGDTQTPGNYYVNARGCYFLSIPDPDPNYGLKNTAFVKARVASNGLPNYHLHLDDCLFDNDGNGVLDGIDKGYQIVEGLEFDPGEGAAAGANRYYKSATPFAGATGSAAVIVDDPRTAYKKVVSSTGALRLDAGYGAPLRDELDTLLFNSLKNQESIVVQKDANVPGEVTPPTGEAHLADPPYNISNAGFGTLNSTAAPTDADLDGMPNFWENALNGQAGMVFNPATADHNAVFTAGQLPSTFFPPGTPVGYTHLEEYLHFLAVPHITIERSTTFTVNLSKFTSGFVASPVSTISNVSNGSVQQFAADGVTPSTSGPVVKFIPTTDYVGRAGFNFKVLDAEGSEWTQQFAILVAYSATPRDLAWIGNGAGSIWNTASALWLHGAAMTTFAPGDNVVFDNRGSSALTVGLSTGVAAGAVTVDSSLNYLFSGAGSVAADSLVKRGAGSLTLGNSSANAFGSVALDEGALTLLSNTAAGTGTISLTGGTLILSPSVAGSAVTNPLVIVGDVTINATTQHEHNAAWTGSGTANVNTTALWTLRGNTSAFAGRVNLGSGASNARLFGSLGSALADWDLGSGTARLYNRNGSVTIDLGSLTGGTDTQLLGASSVDAASTYSIGALGVDTTFAGSIKDGTAGTNAKTNVVKTGVGRLTLTLTGANNYTGTTTINTGTLGAVGTFGGIVTLNSGGKLAPGNAPGHVATLTAATGLTVAGGTLLYDLGATNDKVTVSAGTLTLSGTVTFQLTFTDGVIGDGVYPLIDGGATMSANPAPTLSAALPAPTGTTRQTFTLNRAGNSNSPAFVNLTVSGNAANLVWTGAGGAAWDLKTTGGNFTGGTPSTFANLDSVTFDDTSAIGAVTLTGTLQPNVLTVANSNTAYTFSGGGLLAGGTRLVKNGAGSLTINTTGGSTFTGGTTLNAGTLAIAGTAVTPLGIGPLTIAGGTLHLAAASLANSVVVTGASAITSSSNVTIVSTTTSTLTSVGAPVVNLAGIGGVFTIGGDMSGFSGTLALGTSGGMIRLNGNVNANTGSPAAVFDLGTGSGRLANRNGNTAIDLGALQGGVNTTLQGRQTGSGDTASTYVVGALGTDTAFAGHIVTAGDLDGVNIVKVGMGTWTLSGSSNFTGAITVQQGRLTVAGPLTCSGPTEVQSGATLNLAGGALTTEAVDIAAGAQFTGSGVITGDFTNNGTATCGAGTLSVVGNVVNNGTMRFTGGAVLSATGSFVNNAILDLMTGAQSLPANFINNGVVLDSSLVRFSSVAKTGTTFTATIQGYAAHIYRLQRADTLSGPWTDVGNAQAGSGNLTFTDVGGATGGQKFYRFLLIP